jgi:hypothetical protein
MIAKVTFKICLKGVADSDTDPDFHFDTDLDPAFQFDTDPDPTVLYVRIRTVSKS